MKVKELKKKLEGMEEEAIVEIEIYPPDGGDVLWRDFEVDRGSLSNVENPEELAQSREEYETYVKLSVEHALLILKEHR